MAVAPTEVMNTNEDNTSSTGAGNVTPPPPETVDDHELDTVMPGFRFHPTEEELVEFYLRRKVEGKKFNVDLITFLDLYRYDPWELPAMAAIGEKEWYFYVPRDRKYRNGDRPNRVTTSGYWKATGADRMIRSENSARPIGLKKTLVFYSGKAPKGIRTSWIMNEYRLPHHDTEKYQKAEISLCRVYKRAGLEDHPSVPRSVSTRIKNQMGRGCHVDKTSESTDASSSTEVGTALALSHHHHHHNINTSSNFTIVSPLMNSNSNNNNSNQLEAVIPIMDTPIITPPSLGGINGLLLDNDLHRLVSLQQYNLNIPADLPPQNSAALFGGFLNHHQPSSSSSSSTSQLLNAISGSTAAIPVGGFSDRLWEWNWIPDLQPPTTRDFNTPNFK
ncbi:hypothetical protein V2J09_011478 [Rumex salicifolius]